MGLITVLLVSSYAVALPLPDGENTEASAAVVDLIKSVSGVIGKTGNLVSKIAEISGSDQVKARGDEITSLADEIDAETADTITDGFQKFLEYLPEIKSNINAALDSIPGIKDEVQKQISNMPEKDTIKEHVNSLISKPPRLKGSKCSRKLLIDILILSLLKKLSTITLMIMLDKSQMLTTFTNTLTPLLIMHRMWLMDSMRLKEMS